MYDSSIVTKCAEWIVLTCGRCRWLQDIGTIVEEDIDPECERHQKFKCVTCGGTADGTTQGHGILGRVDIHTPVRP